MFRKPKKKVAARQPIGGGWEDHKAEIEDDGFKKPAIKPEPSLIDDEEPLDFEKPASNQPGPKFSFDHDEGDDADFTLKKDKATVKELKKMKRLEEEAEARKLEEERLRRIKLEEDEELERKRRKKEDKREKTSERSDKDRYLDKYRDENSVVKKHPQSDESDVEVPADDIHEKFPATFDSIPDSKRIYELKKMREKLKNGGFIPLDEDNKVKDSGARERLVREDENDESDDEDRGNFYSSKSLLRNEEERRREEQDNFLAQEQGDDERDPEMEEWEKNQILKAVSRHTIGQIREEFNQFNSMLTGDVIAPGPAIPALPRNDDMDIEVDMESLAKGPTSTGGEIFLDDILAKLRLRIGDREEALNSRRAEIRKMQQHQDENQNMINKIEMDGPTLASKFTMYQELRTYVRSLLDCLNEKVAEINEIADKQRNIAKAKTERLLRRRRRDVQDQYAECSAAASGKSVSTVRIGEAAKRASERDARRAGRRRDRETTLNGISHEEGLSSDDEEAQSQTIQDNAAKSELHSALGTVFVDALDEYSQIKKVLDRLFDWLTNDGKAFEDAFVHLCLPKLCSPFVRIELIQADILNNPNFIMQSMSWYMDAIMAGFENPDLDKENEIVVGLVPMIIEKVVLPFLTDVVTDEWDPLSLRQSTRLGAILGGLTTYPTLTAKSKQLKGLLTAVKTKITASIDEDLYTPLFAKSAVENPNTGCRSFLDRQFWSAIKLLRCIGKLSGFISPETHFELAVENVINKVCVGIQFGITNDATCERKVRALMNEIPSSFFSMGGPNSFRSLASCLNKVGDDQKAANRDFYREVRKYAEKLPR